jgi:hypothetical protein
MKYHLAVGPSSQARDATGHPYLREVTIKRRKKGLHSSTNMDCMRLRNDSYLARMNVFLSQSSKEIHMTSDMFGLSDTKHLHRNAVLCYDDDVVSLPPHNLMMWQPATSEPDSMVWPYHTSSIWP